MKFSTYSVWYNYPLEPEKWPYTKDYTVPENEPFPEAHAYQQWRRDHSLPHKLIAYIKCVKVEQVDNALVVQLPLGFCETKYPGYFWNANEHKLYSLKSGMLKQIPRRKWHGNAQCEPTDGYAVSHLGKRKHLRHKDLLKLIPTRAVIPLNPVPKKPGSRWS